MRVAVTGATGFVGSHLVSRLAREGVEVHVIARPHSFLPNWWPEGGPIVIHRHDGSTNGLIEILRTTKPDVVYHLAAFFVAEHESEHVAALAQSNLAFGMQLLEAMAKADIRRLVNTGTSWQHWQGADYRPVSLYAATKEAFEAVLEFYRDAHRFDVVTVKLYDSYGPRDFRGKLIVILMGLLDQPRELAMSPGDQRVDFVYVDDVVAALLTAGRRLLDRDSQGHERFAVRSGAPLSLRDLVATFERVSGAKLTINWGARPYRAREVMVPWAGENLPGWAPKVGLEEGLRRTLEEYRTGPRVAPRAARKLLSVVAPCFNEKPNIEMLCKRIAGACAGIADFDFEVILVENGSSDGSDELIRVLHRADPRVKMLKLSRNFGYQGAITAGLLHARGEWVAVLDGDQQDPPELVPAMLAKALDGFEVVYGVRVQRRGSRVKTFFYEWFYRIFRALAEIDVPRDAGEFCVMHRRVIDSINAMPERQRFVRGLRSWAGFRQTGFPYIRDARGAGAAKFGWSALLNLGLDGILSFSIVPLRLALFAGLIIVAASIIVGLAQSLTRLADWLGFTVPLVMPPGLTQTNMVMTFLFGVTISCLGIMGEYVGRIYSEVKRRPLFLIDEKLF